MTTHASATQHALWSYCDENEYLSPRVIADFERRLLEEELPYALRFALERFVVAECPRCGERGAFKWHFMGKLAHPECGCSWYVSPGSYLARQFTAAFRMGGYLGGSMASEEGAGTGSFLVGVVLGVLLRLPLSLLAVPFQAILSFTQAAPQGPADPEMASGDDAPTTLDAGLERAAVVGERLGVTRDDVLAALARLDAARPTANAAVPVVVTESAATTGSPGSLPAGSNILSMQAVSRPGMALAVGLLGVAGLAYLARSGGGMGLFDTRAEPLPGWRAPAWSDYSSEIRERLADKRDTLAHVSADFDGDGTIDDAWNLVDADKKRSRTVVLLGRRAGDPAIYEIGGLAKVAAIGVNTYLALATPGAYPTLCGKGYHDCGPDELPTFRLENAGFWSTCRPCEAGPALWFWDAGRGEFRRFVNSD